MNRRLLKSGRSDLKCLLVIYVTAESVGHIGNFGRRDSTPAFKWEFLTEARHQVSYRASTPTPMRSYPEQPIR